MRDILKMDPSKMKRDRKRDSEFKRWHTMFQVGTIEYQIDWGDHPRTGDWSTAFTVYKLDGDRATRRRYSQYTDACRGAAQIYNVIEKKLLG